MSGSVEDVLHVRNSTSSMDMEVTVKSILSGGKFQSRLMIDGWLMDEHVKKSV